MQEFKELTVVTNRTRKLQNDGGRRTHPSVRIAVPNFATVRMFSETVVSKHPSAAAMRKCRELVELFVGTGVGLGSC